MRTELPRCFSVVHKRHRVPRTRNARVDRCAAHPRFGTPVNFSASYFFARASTHLPPLVYMNVPHDLVAAATFVALLFLDAFFFATFFLDFFLPAVSSTLDSIPGLALVYGPPPGTTMPRTARLSRQS